MHYAALSAPRIAMNTWTRAVGPGYYIERFQRFKSGPLVMGRECSRLLIRCQRFSYALDSPGCILID